MSGDDAGHEPLVVPFHVLLLTLHPQAAQDMTPGVTWLAAAPA